ncbi:hypothetical protein [Amycolatopsis dongchuanensis]|uniref:DUF4350 domain-containing protein n=1 Tax=Amycolatopsis dongchuanensis TaxID=1070866 RepID=A0ABP9QWU1_9PSEU
MKRVPRWLVLGVAAGLAAFAALYGPWAQPSAQVRSIVEALRTSSVYEQPGAPGVVDARRARQVIGDRAILLVLLDRSPLSTSGDSKDPRMNLCHQLSEEIPDDYIWVYAQGDDGEYKGNNCVGDGFPAPNTGTKDDFDLTLNIGAELSAQYRATDTDRTPELEEFVLAYDAATSKAHGEIPTRPAVPDRLAGRQLVLACAGLVVGSVLLFFLLRAAGLAWRRRRAGVAARRQRRLALDARLSRLADSVLHPAPAADQAEAERQAEAARRYVLSLDLLTNAESAEELAAAEAEITGLEEVGGR